MNGDGPAGGGPGPLVAIVGRPNVGKSTLLNRLVGRRRAITHASAGVTRDRVEETVTWGGRTVRLVDTGGLVQRPLGIEREVERQVRQAIDQADLVLAVTDATTGITAEDEALARRLRRGSVPVVVVANKVDSERQEPMAAELHALGMGEPVCVSALHGRNVDELLDRILAVIPPEPELSQPEVEDDTALRVGVVGRPNVGKSSLFNRLLAQDRAVVDDRPGTTRDTVEEVVRLAGRPVRFVDTAGLRRMVKTEGIEYYGLLRSHGAIAAASVILLIIDATEGVTGEDKRIAARVARAGRGLVAVLNKWDLIPSTERQDRFRDLRASLEVFPGVAVLRCSALTGSGIHRIPPELFRVHAAWARRASTAEVNRVVEAAVGAAPPPGGGRIMYGTQVSAGPPTFVLFGADPGAAYRRYLEAGLRTAFGLDGVPVRLSFRGRRGERSGPRSVGGARRRRSR